MLHSIPSAVVSKPALAPARVNRTARETGDRIVAMLACPDCEGEGCPSCTDDAPAFADALLEAVQTGLLPDAYEPSAEDWREWELHEGYLQMLAEEAAEADYPPSGFAGFGLEANEYEGR